MVYLIFKIVSFLISPLLWSLFFLITGILWKTKRPRFIIAGCCILFIFSNRFLFDRLMNAWEVPAIAESAIHETDAAIVLCGMSTYDPHLNRIEFNDRSDGLMQALHLYKNGRIKKIILCGGPVQLNQADTIETLFLGEFLTQCGLSKTDLLIENKSRNTHENAVFLKSIIQNQFSGKKILLITSAVHMRRALACFYHNGIKLIPYSTDRLSGPMKYDIDYLLFPSSETLFVWEKLLHEWLGVISYKMMGYL